MATPLMTDLRTVLRAAERGSWFDTSSGVTVLAQALPPARDPDAQLFRRWERHADDLVGQIALARVLLGEPPVIDADLVHAVVTGTGEPRLGVLLSPRLEGVLSFTRFDPWGLAEAYALVASGRLTLLGRMAAALQERDRIELLVAVGVSVASDSVDPWCLSRDALQTVVREVPLAPFVHGMRNKLRAVDAAVRRVRDAARGDAQARLRPHLDDLGIRVGALDDVLDRLGAPSPPPPGPRWTSATSRSPRSERWSARTASTST